MEKWEHAVRLQGFINAVAAGAGEVSEEERQVTVWEEWPRVHLDRLEP